MDDRAELVDLLEVLTPTGIQHLKQDLLLDGMDLRITNGLKLCGIGFVCGGFDAFSDLAIGDTFFSGPVSDRQLQAKLGLNCLIEAVNIPLIGEGFLRHGLKDDIVDHIVAHFVGRICDGLCVHEVATLFKDRLALIIDDVVIFQDVLADLEIALLDFLLRGFDGLVHPRVGDAFVFLDAETFHDRVEAICCEHAHQVIFNRDEEFGLARVALTSSTAAQLVIDPTAFVAFRAEHEQATSIQRSLSGDFDFCLEARFHVGDFGFIGHAAFVSLKLGAFFLKAHFDIAAKLDVGSSASHVRGDRDIPGHASIRDDFSFLCVVAGVENLVGDLGAGQQRGNDLGLFDGGCSEQDRLALGACGTDLFDDFLIFGGGDPVDDIIIVDTLDRFVGWQLEDFQIVDVAELVGFCDGRTGHAGELVIKAEIVLEGDRRQCLVFRLDVEAFLGFDRLVKAFRQTAAFHHPACEFVHQHDLTILDQIILVAVEQFVGAKGLIGMVNNRDVVGFPERAFQQASLIQKLFEQLGTVFGEHNRALFLVEIDVLLVFELRYQFIDRSIEV